jgi:type IV secretory pathway VirB4 component
MSDSESAINLSSDVQERLKKAINEISDSMTRAAAERDLVKEIVNKVAEETQLAKKLIMRMARTFYKNSFDEDVADQRDFENIFEIVTKRK